MDYVPAHGDKNNLADREFVSGARVFDGEDQGKYPSLSGARSKLIKICLHEMLTPGFRLWKQIQNAAVTAGRLDQVTDS